MDDDASPVWHNSGFDSGAIAFFVGVFWVQLGEY